MGTFQAPVEDHLILPARVCLIAGDEHHRQRAGRSVPPPVSLQMLIDTGASRTTLIPGIIRHFQPYQGSGARLNTPLGQRDFTLYWVRLDFPEAGLTSFEHVQVVSLEMPPALAQFHGLIGRDLLRVWDEFRYQGRRGRYLIRDAPGFFGWLRRWLW
jgi:hypothetical protein